MIINSSRLQGSPSNLLLLSTSLFAQANRATARSIWIWQCSRFIKRDLPQCDDCCWWLLILYWFVMPNDASQWSVVVMVQWSLQLLGDCCLTVVDECWSYNILETTAADVGRPCRIGKVGDSSTSTCLMFG